jgi:hypothetical protein
MINRILFNFYKNIYDIIRSINIKYNERTRGKTLKYESIIEFYLFIYQQTDLVYQYQYIVEIYRIKKNIKNNIE